MMLFLKHLSSIQVYDWSEGQSAPVLTFSCTVANTSPMLKSERNLFSRVSLTFHEAAAALGNAHEDDEDGDARPQGRGVAPSAASLARLKQGSSSSFRLELTSTDYARGPGSSQTRLFVVAQVAAGGEASELALELSKHLSAPLVPWGAVAADITAEAGDGSRSLIAPGQAFCFLPLPAMTGLPVQINGFFELSSNRRDIWHGSDLAGAGAQRARWNILLLEQAVAPAYALLLEAAASALGPGKEFDRLWPQSDVNAPWQFLVPPLYRLIADRPVAWTHAAPGRWLPPTHCLLPDAHCLAVEQEPPGGGGQTLVRALVNAGLPLLGLDTAISAMMSRHMVSPGKVQMPTHQ